MRRAKYTAEFKEEAVKQVIDKGHTVRLCEMTEVGFTPTRQRTVALKPALARKLPADGRFVSIQQLGNLSLIVSGFQKSVDLIPSNWLRSL